ncbi:hypothetical protein LWI29_003222 [Acer saccharum]|uniref:Probable DNA helicase MCM8 n=1 Tax=Acer saccharum TaxID=4024 RepID=A0AA39VKZ5_ACESA|nr:hypothetical protein LWI29_003222 [Acer saccharum]
MYGTHGDSMKTRQVSVDTHDVGEILAVYFADNELSIDEDKLMLAVDLIRFFSAPPGLDLALQVKDDNGVFILPLDFQNFRKICDVEVFYATLEDKPRIALSCMSAAVHKVLLIQSENKFEDGAKINIRLHNYPESIIALKNLKAAYIDKLVSVRGTVVKASTVRPLVIQMSFECTKCKSNIPRIFTEGKFSPPMICTLHGCKSRTFTPVRSSAQKIDFQKIRLQELQKSEDHEEGRVPRTVECELSEDLVDACIPGDVVTVTGIIRVINNYMDIGGGKSKSKSQGFYYLYLEAVSVRNSKSQSTTEDLQDSNANARATELSDLFSFSPRDLEFIVKFSEEYGSDTFRQIVQSICPSIYGHEFVKGDPGLGKSQLLQAAAAISPRGIYVCGNATTKAGLTVAVMKDSTTSDYAFEAGAMVLADSGLCCIDEFDKMSAEHQALLEAMEQQCVSVAKAGLVASLSARTSVLAAANPVGGHYNRAKTVNENLKMSAPLLSRFDLVFILLDKPDELLDKRVSDHIMMSKPAAEILQKFYLQLRDHNTSADSTPITARQLESLVRLAEARARLDLREEITAQDALDVVEIMKESLYDKYVDEHGFVDFGRSGGMSQQKEAKRFLSALNKQSDLQQKDSFSISVSRKISF